MIGNHYQDVPSKKSDIQCAVNEGYLRQFSFKKHVHFISLEYECTEGKTSYIIENQFSK